MKKITSVRLAIDITSDEADAMRDAAERMHAIKAAAALLVARAHHKQAPPEVAAMFELFDMAAVQITVSPIDLAPALNPHNN